MSVNNINILIVEDSLTQAEELKYILEGHDYKVLHAINGHKALEELQNFMPEVIISDIVMPGMDGYEFCSILKQNESYKKIPVILLTSLSDPRDVIKGLECGANGFLGKPCPEDFLIERIEYFIQNRDLRDAQADGSPLVILFDQEKYSLGSSPRQILDLLLSTYGNSILKNKELIESNKKLKSAQDSLTRLNATLEHMVRLRTHELEESHDRFKQVSDCSGIWIWEVDQIGLYTYASPMSVDILGYSPEEIVGKKYFYDFFAPAEKDKLTKEAFEIFSRKEILSNLVNLNMHKDGHLVILETSGLPLLDQKGVLIGYRGADKDITDRKSAEEDLRKSEELYRSLFENMLNGFAYCKMHYDPDGNSIDFTYLAVNKAFESLTGLRNVVGKRVSQVIPGIREHDQKLLDIYGQVARGGLNERFEIFLESLQLWFWVSVYSPGPDYFVAVFDVISERKREEEELRNALTRAEESDLLKSAFLRNMSHEIRTPMNAIMGFSSLLLEAEEADRERFVSIILKSSNLLLSTIDEIVYASRLQSERLPLNIERLNASDLINEVCQTFCKTTTSYNIKIQAVIPDINSKLTILSDGDKIRQVLSILMTNAKKYTFEGRIEIGVVPGDNQVEFFVTDTGMGIPQSEWVQIFKPFYRGQEAVVKVIGGAGLGLSIAEKLVALLGGKMGLASEPGTGSRFYFTIPCVVVQDPFSE